MNRNEKKDLEKEFGIEVRERTDGNVKKRKRLIAAACSICMAGVLAVAGISVFAGDVSGESAAKASTVALNLGSNSEETGTQAGQGIVITDVSEVVKDVLPSVVSITSRSLVNYFGGNNYFGSDINDIFDLFFGDSYGGRGGNRYYSRGYYGDGQESIEENGVSEPEEIESGMGSGTIVAQNDSELLILTSYHVVEGSSSLYVTFIDGESVDGVIKAVDEEKDIAVVSVPLEEIPEETLGSIKPATISTEEPEIGDGVIVIGNALGYGTSVTTGILSAKERDIYVESGALTGLLQTDAAINFGNSGGCMLNYKGEMIGIPEAKAVVSYVEGVCYAIPVFSNIELVESLINEDRPLDEQLAEGKSKTGGAFLGIQGMDVTDELSIQFEMPVGVHVTRTVSGSGAEAAGVKKGDIIVGVDGQDVGTMEELQAILSEHSAGDEVVLKVSRLENDAYEEIEISVTLTERLS